MDLYPTVWEIVIRLVLAAVFGGLLGIEREWMRKPAGLRTHMMVSLGAATFSLLALSIYSQVAVIESPTARVDLLRIVDGVMAGIGFLGAGAIIQSRGDVRGLTTAGGIWLAGAIGVAVGGGAYVLAGTAIGLALVILTVMGRLESRLPRSEEADGGGSD